VHSVHAHFLRPVATDVRTRLRVETVRDGRRFAHRRVHVQAGDKVACELFVSFTDEAPGPSYQESTPPPDVPEPDDLESDARSWHLEHEEGPPTDEPLEWRWVGVPWDDWLLATSESDVAHAGRAMTRRQLHDRRGRPVASMVQEMLLLGAP
jgi:acyl-CoA thioesterase